MRAPRGGAEFRHDWSLRRCCDTCRRLVVTLASIVMEDNLPPLEGAPPATPPPVIGQPLQRLKEPKRCPGWKIIAIILLCFLLVSLLLNLGSFTMSFVSGAPRVSGVVGPKITEVMTKDNNASSKIAVIKVEGVITSQSAEGGYTMVEVIKAQLEAAAKDHRVRAVVLKVDSPGGEVLASDEIYRLVADFQKTSRKPVVASMGNLAASGGYYVSAPCRWIVANELTITGSIGVIMSTWNYRGLMDKVGLVPQVYKSGKFKDMLSGSRRVSDISDEEHRILRELINETYTKFKDVVAQGRNSALQSNQGKAQNKRLASDWTEYADGRVFTGVEALRLGFVDELGSFDDALARARILADIKAADVIEYQQHFDFSDLFRLFGKAEPPVVKVDFGVEPPKLRPGLLYFLYYTGAN